jgi:hypothetical protein
MLERAWLGGLRVIVAHAVNSHTLALVSQTRGPYDDKSAGDAQIAAIRQMVASQPFTELALAPSDLRDIIGRGHLAVIIGVELDCLGNFYNPANILGNVSAAFVPEPSDDAIRAEAARLHALGVRYVFPIHLTDNVFGGAALYEMQFDTANRFQFGAFYVPEPAPPESFIVWTLDQPDLVASIFDLENTVVTASLGFDPQLRPAPPPTNTGHRNSRGLQDRGRVLLDALMGLGMMIDVDHMSEKTMRDALAYTSAAWYPLFAGHNGVRTNPPQDRLTKNSERSWLIQDATEMLQRGGMWGIGIKGGLGSVHETISALRLASSGGGLGFGSDCSGLEQLPQPRGGNPTVPVVTAQQAQDAGTVVYRELIGAPADALLQCQFGQRSYQMYREGFAHIGMYPDFLEDGITSGLLTQGDLTELFQGPEALARAWESCLAAAGQLSAERHGPSVAVTANATQFVFWRGTDNNLWEAFWDGAKWNGPLSTGMGPLGSEPTAGIDSTGAAYVCWRGTDNNLWEAIWGGSKWNGPLSLGIGPLGSAPSIAVAPDSTESVFWRGTDNNLWVAISDSSGRDRPPQGLGMGPLGSGPTAGVDGNGHPYVFWRGMDNNLWEAFWDGSKWNGPLSLGMGPLGSAPSVAVASNANQFVFWRGTDNNLWEAFWDGAKWNGPRSLGMGPLGSAPSVAVASNANQFVFWRGTDNNLWEAFWDGAKWNGPRSLGMGPLGSEPTVGVDGNGGLYVFWKGTDNNLWEAFWDGSKWNGPRSLGMGPLA